MRSERLHDVLVGRGTGSFQWINLAGKIDTAYLHIVWESREVPAHVGVGANIVYE